MKATLILAAILATTALVSCEKKETDDNNSGGTTHNAGKNCLGCHGFTAAGTIYNASLSAKSGATIQFTTAANGGGTVLGTFTSDQSGNFHTSSAISFGQGVYVSVKGSGATQYMQSAITSGGCNGCHNGSGTARITAP